MKRVGVFFLGAMLTMSLSACTQDNSAIVKELKANGEKLEKLIAAVEKGGTGRGAARPSPRGRGNRPDPKTVYSVPIDGNPWKGAKHAKVTVVEAFEFA